jgi:hypothetical protein
MHKVSKAREVFFVANVRAFGGFFSPATERVQTRQRCRWSLLPVALAKTLLYLRESLR